MSKFVYKPETRKGHFLLNIDYSVNSLTFVVTVFIIGDKSLRIKGLLYVINFYTL